MLAALEANCSHSWGASGPRACFTVHILHIPPKKGNNHWKVYFCQNKRKFFSFIILLHFKKKRTSGANVKFFLLVAKQNNPRLFQNKGLTSATLILLHQSHAALVLLPLLFSIAIFFLPHVTTFFGAEFLSTSPPPKKKKNIR